MLSEPTCVESTTMSIALASIKRHSPGIPPKLTASTIKTVSGFVLRDGFQKVFRCDARVNPYAPLLRVLLCLWSLLINHAGAGAIVTTMAIANADDANPANEHLAERVLNVRDPFVPIQNLFA